MSSWRCPSCGGVEQLGEHAVGATHLHVQEGGFRALFPLRLVASSAPAVRQKEQVDYSKYHGPREPPFAAPRLRRRR